MKMICLDCEHQFTSYQEEDGDCPRCGSWTVVQDTSEEEPLSKF